MGPFSKAKAVNEVDSERDRHTDSGVEDEIRGLTVLHIVVIVSNQCYTPLHIHCRCHSLNMSV